MGLGKGRRDMDNVKVRVVVAVLGSAATVMTLAAIVGAGTKWQR